MSRRKSLFVYAVAACIVIVLLASTTLLQTTTETKIEIDPPANQKRMPAFNSTIFTTLLPFNSQSNHYTAPMKTNHKVVTSLNSSLEQHPLNDTSTSHTCTLLNIPTTSMEADDKQRNVLEEPTDLNAALQDSVPPPHLLWKNISGIVQVTQNDNLELRSKWQKLQVAKFCRKYGREKDLYVLPQQGKQKQDLYRHLIDGSEQGFIFCFLPKVGCSTLRRLVFVMLHAIPPETTQWKDRDKLEDILRPAIQNTSFLKRGLTDKMRIYKLKNYFKFVMIRNPLERLVSAYRDKIEPPLEFNGHDKLPNPLLSNGKTPKGMDYFHAHRRWILSKYQPWRLKKWAQSNGSYSINVNFTTYVQWIIDSDDRYLNEHFSSILFNTAPCRVDYHLYLNFKNYSREVRLLIKKLNTSSEYFVDNSLHSTTQDETRTQLPYYYSQLSVKQKEQLFSRKTEELDFYYYLYPEEQWSHVELLGVTQPVLNDSVIQPIIC